ncbi:hypothetical protein GCM10009069_30130 [Algimonas arctica]|uniref:Uncharacterized protein n=1 Tax=Algimonas arctica TaxID=1479486 RepID=A0A8J3G3X4_9PROT|nr:hypothetical protein GCM10009069_30130 [Algimonas arctica]
MPKHEKVLVENINTPGRLHSVNAEKYSAMKKAILSSLPSAPPGRNFNEALVEVKKHLPEKLFPGGATSGWWFKTVQLDLEAKRVLKRSDTKPLRWWLV